MCRELKREPAWVAAIRIALLRGRVDVDSVIAESNLTSGHARTVTDVLATMARRDVLEPAPDHDTSGQYFPGPVLVDAAPDPGLELNVSDSGVHRWGRSRS